MLSTNLVGSKSHAIIIQILLSYIFFTNIIHPCTISLHFSLVRLQQYLLSTNLVENKSCAIITQILLGWRNIAIFYTNIVGREHLAKSHWLHLFGFSPLCVFKCLLKSLASEDAKLHWLHLFHFSPLRVFKWLLNALGSEHAYSHWLHLFDFSPLWVFKCVLKWSAREDA